MDRTIKDIEARDIHSVYEMILELAELEHLEHEIELTEEKLVSALTRDPPAAEGLIVYERYYPVAYAIYFHSFSTFQARRCMYLEDLYVRPHYRGNGIGKALLKQLAQIAVQRDCGRLEWAVLAWNEPAVRFYQSIGGQIQEDYRLCRMTADAVRSLADR